MPHPWGNSWMGFLCHVAQHAPKYGRHPQYSQYLFPVMPTQMEILLRVGLTTSALNPCVAPAPPTHSMEEETEAWMSAAWTTLPVPGW